MLGVLRSLISVNLHPAMVHTTIGHDLIRADQFIFEVLPDEHLRPEQANRWHGLDLVPLRRIFMEEHPWYTAREESRRYVYEKSILSVTELKTDLTLRQLTVRPTLDFAFYLMPEKAGEDFPRPLIQTSRWFKAHEQELIKCSLALDSLVRFATTVAVLRTVRAGGLPNNFEALSETTFPEVETPRFLCKTGEGQSCNNASLSRLFDH